MHSSWRCPTQCTHKHLAVVPVVEQHSSSNQHASSISTHQVLISLSGSQHWRALRVSLQEGWRRTAAEIDRQEGRQCSRLSFRMQRACINGLPAGVVHHSKQNQTHLIGRAQPKLVNMHQPASLLVHALLLRTSDGLGKASGATASCSVGIGMGALVSATSLACALSAPVGQTQINSRFAQRWKSGHAEERQTERSA